VAELKEFLHHPGAEVVVESFERDLQISKLGMTSWAGVSFTAYLDSGQIAKLRSDRRVRQITYDRHHRYSAPPPWVDQQSGSEVTSWGRVAVNGKSRAVPAATSAVHIIDSGVGYHDDLPNVLSRENASCGSTGTCSAPVVGCYAHATAVAGVVSATLGNNKTGAGVYAGAAIRSYAVENVSASPPLANCAAGGLTSSTVGYAIDRVRHATLSNLSPGVAQVVNISINPAGAGWIRQSNGTYIADANHYKIINLTSRSRLDRQLWQRGALVVQSAGNQSANVCSFDPFYNDSYAFRHNPNLYSAARTDDGIMVVGAIKNNGTAVNTQFSNSVPAGQTSADPASNFGPCVDVWAPGDSIFTTWGRHTYPNTDTTYFATGSPPASGGWVYTSGTSFAAPHIAAIAAYLLETQPGVVTPVQAEAAVRSYLVQFNGNVDQAGVAVKIPQLP
jgi:Subtilase family